MYRFLHVNHVSIKWFKNDAKLCNLEAELVVKSRIDEEFWGRRTNREKRGGAPFLIA